MDMSRLNLVCNTCILVYARYNIYICGNATSWHPNLATIKMLPVFCRKESFQEVTIYRCFQGFVCAKRRVLTNWKTSLFWKTGKIFFFENTRSRRTLGCKNLNNCYPWKGSEGEREGEKERENCKCAKVTQVIHYSSGRNFFFPNPWNNCFFFLLTYGC